MDLDVLDFGGATLPAFLLGLFTSTKPQAFQDQFWDGDVISALAFQPRQVPMGEMREYMDHDGLVLVEQEGVGFRLYHNRHARAVLLYFHANAELACELDAYPFRQMGLAVFAVDYRGYGWSTGRATLSSLTKDAEAIADKMGDVLQSHNLGELPVLLFGRSIGAVPAVHLAATRPTQFSGLVLECGLMSMKGLPVVQGLQSTVPNAASVISELPEPLQSLRHAQNITLPVLLFHGDQDELIPLNQSQVFYDRVATKHKRLEVIKGANHNSILDVCSQYYYKTIRKFVHACIGHVSPNPTPTTTARSTPRTAS